jgi:hypothetical protein
VQRLLRKSAPPELRAGQVDGHRAQPGAEPARIPQPPEIQEGPERGLLYHVLGVRLGAEEVQARPQHAAAVPFEEWGERPPVPESTRLTRVSSSECSFERLIPVCREIGPMGYPPGYALAGIRSPRSRQSPTVQRPVGARAGRKEGSCAGIFDTWRSRLSRPTNRLRSEVAICYTPGDGQAIRESAPTTSAVGGSASRRW